VTHELMKERLFATADDGSVLGLCCRPPGLLESVCVPGLGLEAMGYKKLKGLGEGALSQRRRRLVLEDMVKDVQSVSSMTSLTSKQRPYTSATHVPTLQPQLSPGCAVESQ
jgi:hypothetical protein